METIVSARTDPLWVSVEGVECSGKSSLTEFLARRVRGVRVVPEFSESAVGRHLISQVGDAPHHISHSPLGQSLLFLADHADLAEMAFEWRHSEPGIVLQDRGYLSKFVYQLLVLQGSMGTQRAARLLDTLMSHIPRPDVTILLDSDFSTILGRFDDSGRGRPSRDDQEFIREAGRVFRSELSRLPTLEGTRRIRIFQEPGDGISKIAARVANEVPALSWGTPEGVE